MKSTRLTLATTMSVMFLAAACASSKPAPSESAPPPRAEAEEAAPAPAKQAKAAKPAPSGTKFAKIQNGMSDAEVTSILGQPTASRDYQTGKQWIPGYYGTDTARTEFIYRGQGRITLSRNRYTGTLKVIRVDYDPNL